ncbi:asparaginase [Paenibacillus sp. DMB20]|uniref:asparaginase n=1 Tax=Paenibacillus sp. DMB20 TaxID=1642570 RepID=UPI0009E5BBCD|nr:asparaginase [Paenibacillus sp. DMB20]
MDSVLIKEYRAGVTECVHSGHIAIVDELGKVKAYADDPEYVAFTRSSAKPLQAIPALRANMADHYRLTDQEIAIMASSHRGEAEHQKTLDGFMDKTGIGEGSLVCASSYPLDEPTKESLLRNGGERRKMFHNCSGKHIGLLAYSKMLKAPLEGYDHPDHPVQQEVLDTVAYMSGMKKEDIRLGTDGCGLPVFALPLRALATAYMKLACPDRIDDERTRQAVSKITQAMNRYPYMVGGDGRVDTLLLQDDNIVAKGGFKGVFCLGLKKERLGIAFKVLDGSEEEWGYIAESLLDQLGYENRTLVERLREAYTKDLYNDGGQKSRVCRAGFCLEMGIIAEVIPIGSLVW